MTIQLGVVGAGGRMGSRVIAMLPEFPEFSLAAAVVSPEEQLCGQQCRHGLDGGRLLFSSDLERAAAECDVLVDFSVPACSVEVARLCARFKKAAVIGTTGLSPQQFEDLRAYSATAALLVTPNTSLGVFVLKKLALEAKRLLGPEFEIEVFELHHRLKMDAPSGTALDIANELAGGSGAKLAYERRGARGQDQVGVAALRGGTVAGEHTILFLGPEERLELTHRAGDRSIFARGALIAAKRLSGRPPGWYSAGDLYS